MPTLVTSFEKHQRRTDTLTTHLGEEPNCGSTGVDKIINETERRFFVEVRVTTDEKLSSGTKLWIKAESDKLARLIFSKCAVLSDEMTPPRGSASDGLPTAKRSRPLE